MNEQIELETYKTVFGKSPFEKWMKKLKDRLGFAKIQTRLDRVILGNFGDHSSVGEGVSELRIDYGPGYRIYYGRSEDKVVVLLCGGTKSTQTKDIQQAIEYWKDWLRKGETR